MSRQLIVNADDFGRTRGTSAGIICAHLNGIVTSTTAMMNLPGVVNDLYQAQAEAPELGLGVHLNFTAGRPLLPLEWVPSLVDGRGRFLSHEALEANPECLNPDELRSELKAQIIAFRNATGRFPDHLDAHHFAHLHPGLFGIYLDLADDFRLPARIPFPQTGAEPERLPPIAGAVPPETVKAIIHVDQQLLARCSIKTPGHFLMTFYDERATLEHLLQLFENLSEGVTELMTHPGVADEQLRNESSYNLQREREITVLTDPRVPAHLAELGIQLITFADL